MDQTDLFELRLASQPSLSPQFDFPSTTMPSSSAEVGCTARLRGRVHRLSVPAAVREKIGPEACQGLEMMFADTYALANESFERRVEIETAKIQLTIANLRFEMVKWVFLFWVSELAAVAGIVFAIVR
jgi:hypothetical protein